MKASRDRGKVLTERKLSEEEKVLNFPEKKDTMHQLGPDIPSLPVDSTKKKGKC